MTAALEELFAALPAMPSMPKVVQSLIASLSQENADLSGIAGELKHDPALSARVLRLANSSFYGMQKHVDSIDDAVMLIGTNSLRTLVVASGVTGAFVRVHGLNLKNFWVHALLTAELARAIARAGNSNAELAYTAGLMHRIGQLVIALVHPDVVDCIERNWRRLPVVELCEAERALLPVDHTIVGAELARRWNFPTNIVGALRDYADPLRDDAEPLATPINLAVQVALGCEENENPQIILSYLPAELRAAARISDDKLLALTQNGAEFRRQATNFL